MPNPYYDHTTFPAPNSAGSSAAMRTELDLIEQGFDKLPSFTGNANKLVAINATETALEPISGNVSLPGNLTVVGSTTLGDAAGDALTIWPNAVTWSSNPTHSGNHTWSGTHTLSAGTANQVQYLNGSKLLTGSAGLTFDGTYLAATFQDTGFTLKDETDATKVAVFELSGISTGTTRTYTLPNVTGALASLGNLSQTFTGTMSFSGTGFSVASASVTLSSSTSSSTINIASAANTNGTTKAITIGGSGLSGSTTNITLGSSVSGATNNITLNGNPTLSGGTANGVLYLNGSKVATSGSALTFDGLNAFALGSGGSTNTATSVTLNATDNAANGGYILGKRNGTNAWLIGDTAASLGSGTGFTSYNYGTAPWIWFLQTGGEQMRLTSTGLGIGTSSPASKLDVNGTISVAGISAVQNIVFGYSGSYSTIQIGGPSSNNGNVALGVNVNAVAGGGFNGQNQVILPNNGALFVNAAGTDFIGAIRRDSSNRLLIGPNTSSGLTLGDVVVDTSGNLGLGVTPSAWGANFRALELQYSSGASVVAGLYPVIAANTYNDNTNWLYKTTAAASYYSQVLGQHRWYTAPSGTAGNAISFTQAMTLDASGNLGVGTTSPSRKLDVQGAPVGVGGDGTGVLANFVNNTTAFNASPTAAISLWNRINTAGSTFPSAVVQAGKENATDGNYAGYLSLQTTNAAGVSLERARITSGGDLYVGQTGAQASEKFGVTTTGAKQAAAFKNDDNSKDNIVSWVATTSGDAQFVGFYTEASLTPRGSITYNRAGGLVAYNTTSDYRAKDIIGPVQNPGATIDALKVYEGVMKGATQSRPMLIAHEAQAHAPYAVSGVKDEVNEDGTPKFQQMDVSSLVPLLLAEIQSLRARVAALEAA